MLALKPNTKVISVSPDRNNIMYTVQLVKRGKEMDKLKWIVNLAKKDGISMPKTIVFCNTYSEIAAVLAYLLRVLEDAAYVPGLPNALPTEL